MRPWGLAALLDASVVQVLPVMADDAAASIRDTLTQWTDDFNAGRADRLCDLFAVELRADYRGFPERDHDTICALLRRSLADAGRHYAYALDLSDIIVAGDLAVVQLTWTLSVSGAGIDGVAHSVEPGMDIFRRQSAAILILAFLLFVEAP